MFSKFPVLNLLQAMGEVGITESRQALRDGKEWFAKARVAIKDIPGANRELGKKHLREGNAEEAWMRFRLYSWLRPEDPEGWYWLGRSAAGLSDTKNAAKYLTKALSLKASHTPAQYELAKLAAPELLPRIPLEVLAEYGDAIAAARAHPWFGPESPIGSQLADTMARAWPLSAKPERILEISAYANHVAPFLRKRGVGRHYTGVGMSEAQRTMQEALTFEGMRVYDTVVISEAKAYLESATTLYDGIVSSDMSATFADIAPLLTAAARRLSPEGIIAMLLIAPNHAKAQEKQPIKPRTTQILASKKESAHLPGVFFLPTIDAFARDIQATLDALPKYGLQRVHHQWLEGMEGLEVCVVIARRS